MRTGQTAIVSLLAVLALSVGLDGCGQGDGNTHRAAPEVGIVTIRAQSTTLTSELPGRTVPYAISDVRPQVSGIVLEAALHRRQRGQGRRHALPDRSQALSGRL